MPTLLTRNLAPLQTGPPTITYIGESRGETQRGGKGRREREKEREDKKREWVYEGLKRERRTDGRNEGNSMNQTSTVSTVF